jgi:hypothetical protein
VTINLIDGGANTELKWERKHASIFPVFFGNYENMGVGGGSEDLGE